jgi:HEAT repeat protein
MPSFLLLRWNLIRRQTANKAREDIANVSAGRQAGILQVIMKQRASVRVGLTLVACCSIAAADERVPILNRWTVEDPVLEVSAPVHYLPLSWQRLWTNALTGPEEDLRREASEAILLEHRRGNAGVLNMKDELLEGFRTATIPTVRLSLATTLIAMDVVGAAADLHEFAETGNQRTMRRIEPALAHWQYEPMFPVWRERLEQAQYYSEAELILAINGLVTASDKAILPHLRTIATSPWGQPGTRLNAADGIAILQVDGLVDVCRELLIQPTDKPLIERQVAVRMLNGHSSSEAQEVMLMAAQDPHSSVSVVAIRRLIALQPKILDHIIPELLQKRDPVIRMLATEALALQPSTSSIIQLSQRLNDPHPDIRNLARESLEKMAGTSEFAADVTEQTILAFNADDWRGIEQAARLIGTLNYGGGAERLVRLLNHDRAEVQVTAAWALREIGVEETLAQMHEFAKQRAAFLPDIPLSERSVGFTPADGACLGYLFESLGRAKYRPAKSLLLQFVPKRYGNRRAARSAAIWALGVLHTDDPSDASLVAQLLARATDIDPISPEYPEVRTAAAVSLGRMRSTESLEALRSALTRPAAARTKEGIKWGIEQISGTSLPQAKPRRLPPAEPFLRSTETD